MPIRKENLNRYPKNWKEIRERILERAGNKCEGSPKYPRCRAKNYKPHPITKKKVVLTIGHLNHNPEDCGDENLKAWCQRCHNTYDIQNRVEGIKERRIKKIAKEHIVLTNFDS